MTVVVDTNVFIISLTSKSPFHRIYTALTKGQFTLAVSNEIILEYLEVIGNKYSQRVAHEFINLLAELPNVIFINIYYYNTPLQNSSSQITETEALVIEADYFW